MVLLGSLYLKGPGYENSRNRQVDFPLEAIFLFVEIFVKFEIGNVFYVFADVDLGVYG